MKNHSCVCHNIRQQMLLYSVFTLHAMILSYANRRFFFLAQNFIHRNRNIDSDPQQNSSSNLFFQNLQHTDFILDMMLLLPDMFCNKWIETKNIVV